MRRQSCFIGAPCLTVSPHGVILSKHTSAATLAFRDCKRQNKPTGSNTMTQRYIYRRGDGNEGNFARFIVELKDNDSPYAALRALVINDYIAGRRTRRHIARTIEVDGESEYGLHACVYDGPDGETVFGAAYVTAELEPAHKSIWTEDLEDQRKVYPIRAVLDRGALALFRKHNH
jgi:hypothetical protein